MGHYEKCQLCTAQLPLYEKLRGDKTAPEGAGTPVPEQSGKRISELDDQKPSGGKREAASESASFSLCALYQRGRTGIPDAGEISAGDDRIGSVSDLSESGTLYCGRQRGRGLCQSSDRKLPGTGFQDPV